MMKGLDVFQIDGLDLQNAPAITKYGYDDLSDSPSEHRWRAWWVDDGGIELRAYPVIKKTPEGAWVDDLAFRERWKGDWMWNLSNLKGKFVFDNRKQSWAKATQEQAIESLAIRLVRWSQRLSLERQKAVERSDALLKLRPDLGEYAKAARNHIENGLGK